MEVNENSDIVLDRAVKVHQALGPGLLESVCQRIPSDELRKAGLQIEAEASLAVEWDGHVIDHRFQADWVVIGLLLIELKSIEEAKPADRNQTLTYIKLAKLPLGLVEDDLHRLADQL